MKAPAQQAHRATPAPCVYAQIARSQYGQHSLSASSPSVGPQLARYQWLSALHEAAHVVSDAEKGRAGLMVILPNTLTGSARAIAAPGVEDEAGHLEHAQSYFAGVVMERVIQGWGRYDIAPECMSDVHNGLAQIDQFYKAFSAKTTPAYEAYKGKSLRTGRRSTTTKPNALIRKLRRCALHDAEVLVAKNYCLIDVVAEIIVRTAKNGVFIATSDFHQWLQSEIAKPPRQRDCSGRIPYIQRPKWLTARSQAKGYKLPTKHVRDTFDLLAKGMQFENHSKGLRLTW